MLFHHDDNEVRTAKASQKSVYCPLVGDIFCIIFDYTPPLYVGAKSFVFPLYTQLDFF
jgi:hypothetical protein